MVGVGPEGHVASIFPNTPAVSDERPVVAVRDCPKPPPTRISLGFPAITSAEEVWLLVSGEGKAEAVARALGGAAPSDVPAAGARGRRATRWLLDEAAASGLPRD
jgi:6-phosphogluconolactonase